MVSIFDGFFFRHLLSHLLKLSLCLSPTFSFSEYLCEFSTAVRMGPKRKGVDFWYSKEGRRRQGRIAKEESDARQVEQDAADSAMWDGQCHVCIKVYLFHREQQVVVFVPLLILMYEAFSSTIDLIPLG